MRKPKTIKQTQTILDKPFNKVAEEGNKVTIKVAKKVDQGGKKLTEKSIKKRSNRRRNK